MEGLAWGLGFGAGAQASAYWEVAAGYVGVLAADIPLTRLGSEPVALRVEEVLITVRPRAGLKTPAPEGPVPAAAAAGNGGSGAAEAGGGGPEGGNWGRAGGLRRATWRRWGRRRWSTACA